MTDRIHSLTVVLAEDVRDDDIEPLTNAIMMLKGVIKVGRRVSDPSTHMAEARARQKLGDALWKVIYPK